MTGCVILWKRCPGLLIAAGREVREAKGLRQLAERAAECGARLLVVDYLQLLGGLGQGSEYERVTAASAFLNSLGNDLGMLVLALSSLSGQAAKDGAGTRSYKGSAASSTTQTRL